MCEPFEISYIEKTESYIEQQKESMPEPVYQFMKQVCLDERKYIEMLKGWGNKKGFGKILG